MASVAPLAALMDRAQRAVEAMADARQAAHEIAARAHADRAAGAAQGQTGTGQPG